MTVAAELLAEISRYGGWLVSADGGVKVVAPAPLPDDLLDRLRQHKPELLQLLAVNDPDAQHADAMDADAREYFAERAAIHEYDGGLSRAEAEQHAARRVFEYQLADYPGRWLVVIGAPDWTELSHAREALALKFGGERVVDVRRYRPAVIRDCHEEVTP